MITSRALDSFRLDNEVAAVTGGGSGIGEAICHALAEAGAKVAVLDRAGAAARRVSAELASAGREAKGWEVDVADATAMRSVAGEIRDHWGDTTVLVNNAGVGHVGTVLNTTPEDLERLWRVNVLGVLLGCRTFLPAMIARRHGAIVNLASIGGIEGIRERLGYCATKFAVVGMTKAMALDHAADGVRINCVCPARVATPFVEARLRETVEPEKTRAAMTATQPLGRMGEPSEIARAVLYLASPASSFTTGSALIVDGGWSAGR